MSHHAIVTELINSEHETESTMKVRFYPETQTYRAFIRVGNKRYRTHRHATKESMIQEATLILLQ